MRFTQKLWFEIVSVVAVVTSLIFLTIEISQSNRIALTTAETELRRTVLDLNMRVAEDSELSGILVKLRQGEALTQEEDFRALSYAGAAMGILTEANVAYSNELLSDYSLGIYMRLIDDFLVRTPEIGRYWSSIVIQYNLHESDTPLWKHLTEKLSSLGFEFSSESGI